MPDGTRCGVPYVCNADEEPPESELEATKKAVEECGTKVLKIIVAENRQPRFMVKFEGPMMMARQRLEALSYDVGTQMDGNNLAFYVSARRVGTSGSWE